MERIEKTGLVLEGGGFRAVVIAAVLDAFHKHDLYFPYAVGVSAGAAYGVSYVSRQLGRNMETNKYIADKRYCGIKQLIKHGNYFNWEFIYKTIPTSLIPYDYEALNTSTTRMQAALTNCETGQTEFFDLNEASPDRFRDILTATSSLPWISKIKTINGKKYLDGGLSDAIPVHHALNQGNDRLVVVLTRPYGYQKAVSNRNFLFNLVYRKYPNLIKIVNSRIERYNKALREIEMLENSGKLFVIRPKNPIPVKRLENNPDHLKEVYFTALKETEELIPSLISWLNA